ncbi:hypothetical protein FRC01_004610 [Tulasnella sp. 417]|nr:hypothetical protein FRC01_004610 [Tulasnella sp. 417]
MQEGSAQSYAGHSSVAPAAETNQININSLFPPELLVDVFDVLHRDAMDSLPFPLPYNEGIRTFKHHPLSDCMLVCRGWCNLIKTMPTYWTFVAIGALPKVVAGQPQDVVRLLGSEDVRDLKGRLKKAGSLPLYVTVAPEYILDFGTVLDILKEHAFQLETINIVKMPDLKRVTLHHISTEQLLQLFKLPLPSLKRLHIDEFDLLPSTSATWNSSRVEIDAPQLYHLSWSSDLLIPQSPSHLTSLFISEVDTPTLRSTLTHGQVQLSSLIHLRITFSEPGLILSALSTPLLQVLIYYSEDASIHIPEELPEYPHLKELQWSDVGPDPTFDLVFRCCPHLARYANYVIGKEEELDVTLLVNLPTVLTRLGGTTLIKWPALEEVLFDCATYAALKALVDVVPTIKRIRTLRDPLASPITLGTDTTRERALLSDLEEKADVVIGLDPWASE